MNSFILIFWAVRLILYLIEQDRGREPIVETRHWRLADETPEGLVEFFLPRFPFLQNPAGRRLLRAVLTPMVGKQQLLEAFDGSARQNGAVFQALDAIQYWAPKQQRNAPELWAPVEQHQQILPYMKAFIRFLFEKHPVPPVVLQLWFCYEQTNLPFKADHEPPVKPVDNLRLYFYLTNGGGLKQTPFLKWEMGRAAAAYFQEAESNPGIHAAYWYAHFRTEGMEHSTARYMAIQPPFGYANTVFWRRLVRLWLNASAAKKSVEQLNLAFRQLEWLKFGVPNDTFLQNEQAAAHYGAAPDFDLHGWHWTALMLHLNEVLGLQEFPLPVGFERNYMLQDENGQQYEMQFIDSNFGLQQEGEAMSHCVGDGSYFEAAQTGEAAFWSLRARQPNGRYKRVLTVEVCNNHIEAACGYANREATAGEYGMLERWLVRAAVCEGMEHG
jgi:hypothetical protein